MRQVTGRQLFIYSVAVTACPDSASHLCYPYLFQCLYFALLLWILNGTAQLVLRFFDYYDILFISFCSFHRKHATSC